MIDARLSGVRGLDPLCRGLASSSRPPTSNRATFLGDRTAVSPRRRLTSGPSPSRPTGSFSSAAKPHAVSPPSIGQLLVMALPGRATGARRTCWIWSPSVSSGFMLRPKPLTRSSSLPHAASVRPRSRRVAGRPRLSLADPNLNRCFFGPRSRTKEPSTRALVQAVAKRISIEAHNVLDCCRPSSLMMAGIR